MRRELSTPYSWVYRWFIPALLTVVAGGALWILVIGREGPADTFMLILAILIASAALILSRILDRAKRVWLDAEQLVFAAYGKEHTVSLTDIQRVVETPFFRPHRIRLYFSTNTPCGATIVFFPPLSITHMLAEHPCTGELKQVVAGTD